MRGSAQRSAPSTAELGLWGERIAAEHLIRDGWSIVGRRVRPGHRDEIDIIARKGGVLAFVEVKTRSSEAFGRPASAVGMAKRRNLCRAAAAYLRRANYPDVAYRFDIIEVVGTPDGEDQLVVRHVADAFRFPERYRFSRRGRAQSRLGPWRCFLLLLQRLAVRLKGLLPGG